MRTEVIGDATLYLGNCLEIMPTLGKVDAVVTDPPYGVNLNYEKSYDDLLDYTNLQGWCEIALGLSKRAAIVPGWNNMFDYPRPDGIMIRIDKTMQSRCTIAYLNKWQPVFIYGKPIVRFPWDIFETWNQSERSQIPIDHPCPYPHTLTTHLVKHMTEFGEMCLDPFMGSGTTGVACVNLGRKFIGIEIEPKYFDIACKRIDQAERQGVLFQPQQTNGKQESLLHDSCG